MSRKIIQIAASESCVVMTGIMEEGAAAQPHYGLYALCDDGTLWTSNLDHEVGDYVWLRLPAVPQDDQC